MFLQKIQEIHDSLGPEEMDKQIRLLENPFAKRHTKDAPRYALTVLPEYCHKILHENKTWEIRGQKCAKHLNERICVAESGSGMLVGEMVISESRLITRQELEENPDKHQIENLSLVRYKNIYAWTVTDVEAYAQPRPYERPTGAVNWVDLQYFTSGKSAALQCANEECTFGMSARKTRGKPYTCSTTGTAFDRCIFCSKDAFIAAMKDHSGQTIRRALDRLKKKDVLVYNRAQEVIRDVHGQEMVSKLGPSKRCRKKAKKEHASWAEVLQARKPQVHKKSNEAEAILQDIQKRQHDRLKRKFPSVCAEEAREVSEWMPPRSAAFRKWCLWDSWQMCSECSRMVPTDYRRSHAKGTAKGDPQIKACSHCKSNAAQGYWAPTPEDVPRRLRKLSAQTIEALRPLQIHPTFKKPFRAPHGYLVHADMMQFSFMPISVEEALTRLPRKERRRGEKALSYLKRSDGTPDTSSYVDFWRMHQKFLRHRERAIERGDIWADAPVKRMPANFIETAGLECALWPHLYWNKKMTETYVRSQDARRLNRRRQTMDADEEDEMREEDAAWQPAATRQSAKASFLAKVHSAVIGYNSDPQLLQFVYDLWLFTTIGGAKNASGVGIREALANKPYSPEVWRTYHTALVDLQRQIGWPSLFITIAPYEWSFPYHAWMEDRVMSRRPITVTEQNDLNIIEHIMLERFDIRQPGNGPRQDELAKSLKERLYLPVSETLHLAHVLTQTVKSLLADTKQGIFAAGPEQGSVVYWVARLEFQDGMRKRRVHSYHGRGTPHAHILLWLRDVQNVNFADKIHAHLPEEADTEMLDLVKGSQLDWQMSGWPVREEPTEVTKSGTIQLYHPKKAHAQNCRAYLPDVLAALRCHCDVLASDGRAMVLKYCVSH